MGTLTGLVRCGSLSHVAEAASEFGLRERRLGEREVIGDVNLLRGPHRTVRNGFAVVTSSLLLSS